MFSVVAMPTLFLIAGVASHSSGETDMATFFSQENGTYLYHIKRNDLFLVGVSKYEASSITAVEFLSRWVIKQLGKTWLKDIYSYHKYTNGHVSLSPANILLTFQLLHLWSASTSPDGSVNCSIWSWIVYIST